jgi:hypothetical protein
MYLTRRQIYIIGGSVILLIVIVLIMLWINRSQDLESPEAYQPVIYDLESVSGGQINQGTNSGITSAEAAARNFTERYFSYSNQNWGENLEIMRDQMTSAMWQKSQQELNIMKEQRSEDQFYGVSARVITQEIISDDEGDYRIRQDVQFEESIGNDTQINYLSYQVQMIQVGDEWLINSIILD